MAKNKILLNRDGWKVEQDGDMFTVTYRPPGGLANTYTGHGKSTAEAFLDLPIAIRCLPAADRFIEAAKDAKLIEIGENEADQVSDEDEQ